MLSSVFGVGVLSLPERQQFGMSLHLERIRYHAAIPIALGIHAIFNHGKLDRGWFDALASDESEVDAMEARVNAERAHAAALAKYGITR